MPTNEWPPTDIEAAWAEGAGVLSEPGRMWTMCLTCEGTSPGTVAIPDFKPVPAAVEVVQHAVSCKWFGIANDRRLKQAQTVRADAWDSGRARAGVVDECAAAARHEALKRGVPFHTALQIEAAVRTLAIGPVAVECGPIPAPIATPGEAFAKIAYRGQRCERCDGRGKYTVPSGSRERRVVDCGACGATGEQ